MEQAPPVTCVLTITQFAKRHAVHRRTIFNWFKAGKLPPDALRMYQLPSGHWRIEVFKHHTHTEWANMTKDQRWHIQKETMERAVAMMSGAE